MLLEGKPLSDFDNQALTMVQREYEETIIKLQEGVKEIEKIFDSRIEFKPLGRITWNALNELENNIRKKYSDLLNTDSKAFDKKFDEIVAMVIPDPTKVSKRMLDELEDANHHRMFGAIYDRLPEVIAKRQNQTGSSKP